MRLTKIPSLSALLGILAHTGNGWTAGMSVSPHKQHPLQPGSRQEWAAVSDVTPLT